MTLNVFSGEQKDADECCSALKNCILWDNYFVDDKKALSFIIEGIDKGEIYVAKNESNDFVGFMRIDERGMFAKFPLLRLIAVGEQYRNKGFGREMLGYYQELSFKNADKIFLCVSEFNPRAKKLYMSLGYFEVGAINGLYKKGVTEYIMMKCIN